MNQPNFVLDIYSKIIHVYTDTSTSIIFQLQPLILSNESHSRLISSKINNHYFYNDNRCFILSDIKNLEIKPFKEKTK